MLDHTIHETISANELARVTGGAGSAGDQPAPAASDGRLTRIGNAARGFVGGLRCLGAFTVDGTPGTNSYDTYLACQRRAHQF